MPNYCRFVVSLVLLLCSASVPSTAQEEIPSAFNTIVLNAPPVPQPPPPTKFGISLQSNAAGVLGLSIPHPGSFYGFSIEMSVANQIGVWHAIFLSLAVTDGCFGSKWASIREHRLFCILKFGLS